jgi:asparagine synthase (glutamine-hydrolysing)
MANFVICVDANEERRRQFMGAVSQSIHLLPGLIGGECSSADFACVWAAGRQAPVSAKGDADGAQVVWGLAFSDHVDQCVDAMNLATAWRDVPRTLPAAFEGYHAAVSMSRDGTLVLGGDRLGLYPLYYWSDREVFLAGSSAELFRLHPRFHAELDIEGLLSILLIMTTFDGKTLFKGVRRPDPGHLVVRGPEGHVTERLQYEIPLSDASYGLPFTALVNKLNDAMGAAVERQVSRSHEHLLLLSGGLDSRTLAGYLSRDGYRPIALTFGAQHENEMKFGKKVARAAGFEHRGLDLSYEKIADWAEHHARWAHLASGFLSIEYWQVPGSLSSVAPRMINGYLLDAVAGGSHIDWCMDWSSNTTSVDKLLARLHSRAATPENLKGIVATPVLGRMVDEVADQLKSRIRGLASSDAHRAWLFDLRHRQRFHVGWILWADSFGSWPVSVSADGGLLACMAGMPVSGFAERVAQKALLTKQFPHLAKLQLDRASADTSPLLPTAQSALREGFRWRLAPLRRLLENRPWARDPHHFVKFYDYDGPSWRRIRARASGLTKAAETLFPKDRLHPLLGDPDAVIGTSDHFTDRAERRLLNGFLLWKSQFDSAGRQ